MVTEQEINVKNIQLLLICHFFQNEFLQGYPR